MMSMNSAYVDELYFEYLRNPESVSPEWRSFFASYTPETAPAASAAVNAAQARPVASATPATVVGSNGHTTRLPALGEGDTLVPLSSIGGKIAENMEASLRVPTATSVRNVPVKALEENRRIANIVLA